MQIQLVEINFEVTDGPGQPIVPEVPQCRVPLPGWMVGKGKFYGEYVPQVDTEAPTVLPTASSHEVSPL